MNKSKAHIGNSPFIAGEISAEKKLLLALESYSPQNRISWESKVLIIKNQYPLAYKVSMLMQ